MEVVVEWRLPMKEWQVALERRNLQRRNTEGLLRNTSDMSVFPLFS